MVDDSMGMLPATAEHLQLNFGVASRKVELFRPELFERLQRAQRCQNERPLRNVGRVTSLVSDAPARSELANDFTRWCSA